MVKFVRVSGVKEEERIEEKVFENDKRDIESLKIITYVKGL